MNKREAKEFFSNQAGNVWSAIVEMSMTELKKLKVVANELSTTNCWWATYYMKDAFLKLINDRISFLELQNKKSS